MAIDHACNWIRLLWALTDLGGGLQMEEAQAQAREGQRRQQELYQNPFGSAFRSSMGGGPAGMRGMGGGPRGGARGASSRQRGPAKPGPDFAQQPGGPIIDVESYTVDEGDR